MIRNLYCVVWFLVLSLWVPLAYCYLRSLELSHNSRLESVGQPYCWNEIITLSTKYRDLTAHSQLALTVSYIGAILKICH